MLRVEWTEGTKSDSFIMVHTVIQNYYVPYPSMHPRKRGWCMVIKSIPMGHIETDDLTEEVAYQDTEISPVNDEIEVESISNLCDTLAEVQQVDYVDEKHEEFRSEDNIGSSEDNEGYKDKEDNESYEDNEHDEEF